MQDSKFLTYFPKSNMMFQGDYSDINQTRPNEYLASLDVKTENPDDIFEQATTAEFEHVAENVGETRKQYEKLQYLKRAGARDPAARLEQVNLENSAELNDSAINQITIVQFVQQIIGKIANSSNITRAFTKIQSPRLRGKIPEGGWPSVSVQVGRLSEPTVTHSDFGQTEFRIRRNDIHIYISREDRMEAAIDPFTWTSMQGQRQLMQTRELLALQELANLEVNNDYGTFEDFTTRESGITVPRSEFDATNQFMEMMVEHWKEYRNELKYFIMHPQDYRTYLTNFYVRNNIKQDKYGAWGVTPFVGLEEYGAVAITSPWCPRLTGYALTTEGAYEIDGPKIVDTEYDPRKFADYSPMRDFVGYLIVNPERFGEKITFQQSGVTSETEITTHAQIETLLNPPEVQKNARANSTI